MAGGAVVALVAAGVTFQSANASDNTEQFTAKTLSAIAAGNLASTLNKDLGADAAGTYYDADARTLVVNVLDESAAQAVRKAGGKARIVENTLAELKTARQTLTTKATIPGTSWAVDPVTNKVVVTADRTVKGAQLTKLSQVVKGLGDKAELKESAGSSSPSSRAATRSRVAAAAAHSGSMSSRTASRSSLRPGTAPRRSPPGPTAAARRSARTRTPASRTTTSVWSSTPRTSRTPARSTSTTAARRPSPRRARRPSV